MKFYIKKYEEIEKNSFEWLAFIPAMRQFCGKGPFEFEEMYKDNNEWLNRINEFEEMYKDNNKWLNRTSSYGYTWHISWLIPYLKNGQYVLEFE